MLGGLLSLIAYFPYWYSIFTGHTRPQRASWLIWIFSDSLVLATSGALGARDSLWVPVAYVIGTIITFIFSIKKGQGGTHWFDIVCLGITFMSGVLWYITGNPFQSLLINLTIVAIGTIPTLLKVSKDPYSENMTGFIFWTSGSFCSFLAVMLGNRITIELWLQPLWFLGLQFLMMMFIIIYRSFKRN